MTTQHNPITPPPELVHQWADMLASGSGQAVFAVAAQWGAEQEMHAICDWLDDGVAGHLIHPLLCARRPKPLSLKEQDTICAELVAIEDALSGGSVQLSNQGQAMDGYAALAAFRAVAEKARAVLNDL